MAIRILSADEIYAANDIEERDVEVPQWGQGVGVRIRTLTQRQSAGLRKQATRMNQVTRQQEIDNELLEALLFVEGVIEPKFTMADYGKLQDKSMAAMSLILKEIMAASGLSEDAIREATKSPENGVDHADGVLHSAGTPDDAG